MPKRNRGHAAAGAPEQTVLTQFGVMPVPHPHQMMSMMPQMMHQMPPHCNMMGMMPPMPGMMPGQGQQPPAPLGADTAAPTTAAVYSTSRHLKKKTQGRESKPARSSSGIKAMSPLLPISSVRSPSRACARCWSSSTRDTHRL